jgi:kynurenine formamidase
MTNNNEFATVPIDNDAWAAEVTEMDVAFEALERRGLVVACGQRWDEHRGRTQTIYKMAPGVTRENFFALAFDAYDVIDMPDEPPMLSVASA